MRNALLAVLIGVAACAPSVAPVPKQATHVVQWTAVGDRLEIIPLDSTPDAARLTPLMRRGLPRDFIVSPRIGRIPFPPIPVPASVRGLSTTFLFVVDSTGRVERLSFVGLRDHDYDRRLVAAFRQTPFEPARKPDGTATRGFAQVAFTF
jgi:hypothetical protein